MKVYKANMIIPQIAENVTKSGTYTLPRNCPCCGEPLTVKTTSGGTRPVSSTPLDVYKRQVIYKGVPLWMQRRKAKHMQKFICKHSDFFYGHIQKQTEVYRHIFKEDRG